MAKTNLESLRINEYKNELNKAGFSRTHIYRQRKWVVYFFETEDILTEENINKCAESL